MVDEFESGFDVYMGFMFDLDSEDHDVGDYNYTIFGGVYENVLSNVTISGLKRFGVTLDPFKIPLGYSAVLRKVHDGHADPGDYDAKYQFHDIIDISNVQLTPETYETDAIIYRFVLDWNYLAQYTLSSWNSEIDNGYIKKVYTGTGTLSKHIIYVLDIYLASEATDGPLMGGAYGRIAPYYAIGLTTLRDFDDACPYVYSIDPREGYNVSSPGGTINIEDFLEYIYLCFSSGYDDIEYTPSGNQTNTKHWFRNSNYFYPAPFSYTAPVSPYIENDGYYGCFYSYDVWSSYPVGQYLRSDEVTISDYTYGFASEYTAGSPYYTCHILRLNYYDKAKI